MLNPSLFTRRTLLRAGITSLIGLGVTPPAEACHRRRRALRHCPNVVPTARAAFTCDFGVSNDLSPEQIVQVLERDRLHMSARSGFIRKHIPLRINASDGSFFSGGRYLFETLQDAVAYERWVVNDYVLDGIKFFDRPYILDPNCRTWAIAGMLTLGDVTDQVVTRMERWHVPANTPRAAFQEKWPAIVHGARQRCLTSVWLLDNAPDEMISLVYFRGRLNSADQECQGDPQKIVEASLKGLESMSPLGQVFDDRGWTKTFDRTQWVFTVWFPFVTGDHGRPPLWPNSPPLPEPFLRRRAQRNVP